MDDRPRIVMMGTGTFARPTFEALLAHDAIAVVGLVTQPDREAGQVRGSTRQTGPSLKDIAVARGIPVFQPASVNTAEGIAQLRNWRPDLLVVAAYGQILNKAVLEAARLGGINVHASLLPKFRGAAPVASAILRGETTTGVTIIRMTTGLDAGAMLGQQALDIVPDETAGELEARLAPIGAALAVRVAGEVLAGTAHGVPQEPALATKAPKLKKEDGLIDWTQPAEQVCRQIRAMQPWPTAYTFLHRAEQEPLRVMVARATSASLSGWGDERTTAALAPGSVIDFLEPYSSPTVKGTARLWVVAGSGTIVQVLELQPAGKKRMTAGEFLRGRPLRPGDRFGAQELNLL